MILAHQIDVMALFEEAVSESKSGRLGRSQLVVGRFPLVAAVNTMQVPQQETTFQELRSELVMSPLNLAT